MARLMTWDEQLDQQWADEVVGHDVDWGLEQLLVHDVAYPEGPARCGSCGGLLNTNGTCSLCDRA